MHIDLDKLRAQLALVPDLRDEPKLETFPSPGMVRTRHVIRRTDGQLRTGSFIADVVINDFFDEGASYKKHSADDVATGEALVNLMVHAPSIIRSLVARIDQLEAGAES